MVKSGIFIGHVRSISRGGKEFKNTHPFKRELNGREYIFAHNGTLENYKNFEISKFKPIGETDSEYIFCYLLNQISKKEIYNWEDLSFEWLFNKLKEINRLGKFNCLFSDGKLLYCYHDIKGYKGLYYLKREAPFTKIQLSDEDYEINLKEEKDPKQKGYIIASNKLTNEKWEKFVRGELIIFKEGSIKYRDSE